MPRHIWSVVCQQVIIDRETNTPSYITCLEGFTAPDFPVSFPPIFVGSLWRRTAPGDEIEMRVRIMSPEGDVLHTRAHQRKASAEFEHYRINLRLGGFDITGPGEYEVLVEHNEDGSWSEDARIPLTIRSMEEA